MSKELKPCPFCGSPAEESRDTIGSYGYYCVNPDCCTLNKDFGHHATGRKAWNTRTIPEASNPAAEAATCKLCQSTGPDVPCAYPTEINRQQAQRIADLEAMLAGCPTADGTLKPVAYVPIHPRTGPLWANTVPDLDSGDRPKHYPTRALYFAEDAAPAVQATAAHAGAMTAEETENAPLSPAAERAVFNSMMRWHLIRMLQAWRYGGNLRTAGTAAFEWARTNDVGKEAFQASERAVNLGVTTDRALSDKAYNQYMDDLDVLANLPTPNAAKGESHGN